MADAEIAQLKTCTKCKASKPTSCFPKNKGRRDGLLPWCRTCKSDAAKNHYRANPQSYIERAAKKRAGRTPNLCIMPGCGKARFGHGYCNMHLYRLKTHGDPNKTLRPGKGVVRRWVEDVALKFESDNCLKWPFKAAVRGYGKFRLDGREVLASRYICERVNGSPPSPQHEAAHSCGKGHEGCVNKRHLSWKTPSENAADKIVHGTTSRGEQSALAKLTESDVLEIRRRVKTKSQRQVAFQFGIDPSTVSDIMRGKSWSWL